MSKSDSRIRGRADRSFLLNFEQRPLPLTSLTKRRKHVTIACTDCKRRRTKCDGRQPCTSCSHARLKCCYLANSDGRTKQYRQKNLTLLENHSRNLNLLYDKIKFGGVEETSTLIAQIRSQTKFEFEAWLRDEIQQMERLGPSQPQIREVAFPYTIPVEYMARGSNGLPSVASTTSLFDDDWLIERYKTIILRSATESQTWHPALQIQLSPENITELFRLPFEAVGEYGSLASPETVEDTYQHCSLLNAMATRHVPRGLSWTSDIRTNGFPSAIQKHQLQVLEQPEWSILPLSFDDGSPLCRAYVSFWEAARTMITRGTPPHEILGDMAPCVDVFFKPHGSARLHTVSYWASSIMSSFTEFDAASKLRSVLLYHQLMRWMISPSPETYRELSVSQRPTIAQRMIPHSATIDLVHQAELRTLLCQNPRDWLTAGRGATINWVKSIDEAVEMDEDGSLHMTQDFEKHALDLDNWTYAPTFLSVFPELAGIVRIQDS